MCQIFKILLCIISTPTLLIAQNLIPNSGFELSSSTPSGKLTDQNNFTCDDWSSPNKGTPDYYCDMRIDRFSYSNWLGTQLPYLGKAYIGFSIFGGLPLSSEYIQTKLKNKLVKDEYYCLKLHLSLAEKSTYAINEVDYLFREKEIKMPDSNFISSLAYRRIVSDSAFEDKTKWIEICSCFKAHGNEEFLIIGNFNKAVKVKDFLPKNTTRSVEAAYYFFDEISLTKIDFVNDCYCHPYETFEPNDVLHLTLNNLLFNSDQFKLKEDSSLIALVKYLKNNSRLKIIINGYTDSTGDSNRNLKLSILRAKSLSDYLINFGIQQNRISYYGYGSSKPIKPDTTEENKLINRRAEIIITK